MPAETPMVNSCWSRVRGVVLRGLPPKNTTRIWTTIVIMAMAINQQFFMRPENTLYSLSLILRALNWLKTWSHTNMLKTMVYKMTFYDGSPITPQSPIGFSSVIVPKSVIEQIEPSFSSISYFVQKKGSSTLNSRSNISVPANRTKQSAPI